MLGQILQWVQEVCLPWINTIYPAPKKHKGRWKRLLFRHVHLSLAHLRIDELFDIVACYPDSLPALYDTQRCLFFLTPAHDRLDGQEKETGEDGGCKEDDDEDDDDDDEDEDDEEEEEEEEERFRLQSVQSMKRLLVTSLTSALRKRLLHAGVGTSQVSEPEQSQP